MTQKNRKRASSPTFFVTLNCGVERKKAATSTKVIKNEVTSPKKFHPIPIQAPDSTTSVTSKSTLDTAAADSLMDSEDCDLSLTKMKEKLAAMQAETKKLKESQESYFLMLKNGSLKQPNSHLNDVSRQPDGSKSIYVGNVHFSATEKQLSEHFSVCGKVRRATILKDHYTGHPKGFAYLEFEEESSVEMSLALNSTQFCSRNIVVTKKSATPAVKPSSFPRPTHPPRFFPRLSFYSRPRAPFRPAGPYTTAVRPRFFASKNKTWVKPGLNVAVSSGTSATAAP